MIFFVITHREWYLSQRSVEMVEDQTRMQIVYGPDLKRIKKATSGASLLHFSLAGDKPGGTQKVSFKVNGWEDTEVSDVVRISLAGINDNKGKNFTASFNHVRGGGFLVQDV